MTASEHLSGLQFQHHTSDDGMHHVMAYGRGGHGFPGTEDAAIGHLRWDTQSGEIQGVSVYPTQRHQGVATGMLNYARESGPGPAPVHSESMSPAGRGWAASA